MPDLGHGKMLLGVMQGFHQARQEQEQRDFKKELLKLEQQKLKLEEKDIELKHRAGTSPISIGGKGVYSPDTGAFSQAPWGGEGENLRNSFMGVPEGTNVLDLRGGAGTTPKPVYSNPKSAPEAKPPNDIAIANELMTRLHIPFDEAFRLARGKDKKSFVQDAMKSLGPAIAADPQSMKMLGGATDVQKIFEDIYDRNQTGSSGTDDFFNSFGSEVDKALRGDQWDNMVNQGGGEQ